MKSISAMELLGLLCTLAVGPTALAKGMDIKEAFDIEVSNLQEKHLAPFNETCKTQLKADIDLAKFDWDQGKRWNNRDWYRYGITSYCGPILDAIRDRFCGKPDGAKKVRERLKSFLCTDGHAGHGSVKLVGSKLVYAVDFARDGELEAAPKAAVRLLSDGSSGSP